MNERDLIRNWMVWKEKQAGESFSQKALAKDAGLSPTYLSSILTGTRNAGSKTMERIAAAFGVSRAEFYAGPGSFTSRMQSARDVRVPAKGGEESRSLPEKPRFNSPESQPAAEPAESAAPTGWNLSWTPSEEVERLLGAEDAAIPQPRTPAPDVAAPSPMVVSAKENGIPVLREIPGGGLQPGNSGEYGSDHPVIPRTILDRPGIFAVRVEDDSMTPLLERGSVVVADPGAPFDDHPGRIAVAAGPHGFLVRLVQRTTDGRIFFPANPAYASEEVSGDDAAVFPVIFIIPPGIIPA